MTELLLKSGDDELWVEADLDGLTLTEKYPDLEMYRAAVTVTIGGASRTVTGLYKDGGDFIEIVPADFEALADEVEKASAQAADGQQDTYSGPAAEVEDIGTMQEAILGSYIDQLIAWFPSAFDGYVYNSADPSACLPRQVKLEDFQDLSNLQQEPPSWQAQARLSYFDTGEEIGVYPATVMVVQDVPYAYLDPASFDEVAGVMSAAAETFDIGAPSAWKEESATGMLSLNDALALLVAGLEGTPDMMFYREGDSSPIVGYEISVEDPRSIAQKVGEELAGERGWWIYPHLQVTPSGDGSPPNVVQVNGAKLLVSPDNTQVWIEIPRDQL